MTASVTLHAVAGLSPSTWLQRFGGAKRQLTESEVSAYLDVGRAGRRALVAVDVETGEIVGVARYAPVGADPAVVEAAVVVSDEWQGRGIGRRLVDELLADAHRRGVVETVALTMTGNAAVTAILRRHGFSVISADRGTTEWVRRSAVVLTAPSAVS